ncbi:hypothetical protein LB452_13250 [Psychroflexus sp. CAK8W]|uniref:GIY-YIG domain-containing protein n=1 Tax=Psychroflexus longus TaxID=2873596 RepID=A0ABS7XN46_9FLAO|nr:hypothetical protein [Psychroflexus longus]MBZ9779889.1 hypothetical protein [Psychroflexus longus]
MMKINGFNNYELEGSFIYFIFSKDLLYIGETQKITFSRWVQHFYKSGTFSKKIKKHGIIGVDYISDVKLLSVELIELREEFPELRWKTLTQAIEHSLHVEFSRSQTKLIKNYYEKYEPEVNRFNLVSDTSRTCPKSISNNDWKYAENFAKNIINHLCNFL